MTKTNLAPKTAAEAAPRGRTEQNRSAPAAPGYEPQTAPGCEAEPTPAPEDKALLDRLERLLRACSPMALAFSGGLDSRFLAHMALRAGKGAQAHLFHIQGPHVQSAESARAVAWAADRGLGISLVSLNPLDIQEVRANNKLRCYHCKRFLFTAVQNAASAHAFFSGRPPLLCDGSNASDSESYRPGTRALAELGVRSPLAEAGLRKDDIRRLAALTGMDRPDQQARPCLLTRFAYGLSPTPETLAGLEKAENALAKVLAEFQAEANAAAVPDFRLRFVAGPGDAPKSPAASPGDCPPRRTPLPPDALPVELHLDAEVPESLRRRLIRTVSAQGLAVPRLRVLDKLSGHYDR